MSDIIQDVQEFFADNIPLKPFTDEESEHFNKSFLDFLHEHYDENDIKENLPQIQKTIKTHFHDIGRVLFKFNYDRGEFFKLYTYEINPIYSRHFKPILDLLHYNQDKMEYPYLDRNDQILINSELKHLIDKEIENSSEVGDKRELVRVAIKEALDLGERDIILFMKDKIIVKIFQKIEKLNAKAKEPKPKNTKEQRFRGYDPVELENYYKEVFETISIKEFMDEIVRELLKKELNFSKITNDYFEKNSLNIISNAIADKLGNILEEDGDFVMGFSGFVFRKHFFEIFEQIGENLLKEIVGDNENAKKFLSYYSGETVMENGKKYILPSLVTADGRRWNISSVLVISKTWLAAENNRKRAVNKLKEAEISLSRSTKLWSEASDVHNEYKEQKDALIDQMRGWYKQVDEDMRKLKSSNLKPAERSKISARVKESSAEENKLLQRRDDLNKKIKEAYNKSLKYHKKYKEDDKMVKDLNTKIHLLDIKLKESSKDYKNFLIILVKALTKRKKLVRY